MGYGMIMGYTLWQSNVARDNSREMEAYRLEKDGTTWVISNGYDSFPEDKLSSTPHTQ